MCVDSMKVRRLAWENHKEVAFSTKLIIDARMGAEVALAYAMKPVNEKDIISYEKTLYSDEDAEEERCTAKATVYCVLAISSHIVKIVKDFTVHPEQKYTRVCQWSIKENKQECYSNQK